MGRSLLLRLSLLVTFLSISVTARPGPCNTLIFFTTTTTSSYPITNSHVIHPSQPRSITVFFTRTRPIDEIPVLPSIEDRPTYLNTLGSSVSESFKDRSNDILRVVGSLLFGVGCGVLTSATLYLVWSLFAPARFAYEDDDEEEEFEEDDDVGVKKGGYVAIPCKGPVKEVV